MKRVKWGHDRYAVHIDGPYVQYVAMISKMWGEWRVVIYKIGDWNYKKYCGEYGTLKEATGAAMEQLRNTI